MTPPYLFFCSFIDLRIMGRGRGEEERRREYRGEGGCEGQQGRKKGREMSGIRMTR